MSDKKNIDLEDVLIPSIGTDEYDEVENSAPRLFRSGGSGAVMRAGNGCISDKAEMKKGIELIADERKRQQEDEGWTAGHDDRHVDGSLAMAAALYATPEQLYRVHVNIADQRVSWEDPWPWHNAIDVAVRGECPIWSTEPAWDKRGEYPRLRQLVIAGALIAAEIDRLQRLATSK